MTEETLPAQVSLDDPYDALVIGAGAGGVAVALRMAQRGLRVLCLEQGSWQNRDLLPKAHLDWELRGRRYWHTDPTKRKWPADYPVKSVGETKVNPMLYNAVGGSSIGFGGVYWRLLPSDFRTYSLDGFGVDWPVQYEDLASYYRENELIIGMSGVAGDPTEPEREDLPVPPVQMGKIGRVWAEGFEKLGWYWWAQDCAISTRDYGYGRHECVGRGYCRFGCPSKALASADVAYWPQALEAGVSLITEARVKEIVVDASGMAKGVSFFDASGTLHEARASIVVVSCGGIGTPRLLLMSKSERFPDGLGNSSNLVGKNLMTHVNGMVAGRFSDTLEVDHGAWGGSFSSREFYETSPENGYLRGFTLGGRRGLPPLETAFQAAPWGAGHLAAVESRVNHEGVVAVLGDDEPEESNHIELDFDHTDGFGLPGVRLHYRLSDNSRALGLDGLRRARELCLASGAIDTRDNGLDPIPGWHLMGTARMGDDPRYAVVDRDHRSFDVPNLFLVDGSSMPTGGSVNPTNTIQAMALRAGDRISELRHEFDVA